MTTNTRERRMQVKITSLLYCYIHEIVMTRQGIGEGRENIVASFVHSLV